MLQTNMLSVEECRKLLDNEKDLTDEQVTEIRNSLYELAELALDCYFEKKKLIGNTQPSSRTASQGE